jgi:hypothetical protein
MINTVQAPEKWNFKLYRGDRWPAVSFQIEDENGDAVTGFTTFMQIKRSARADTAIKTMSEVNGFYEDENKRTFDTDVDLPAGVFVFDIEVILSNGTPHTIYTGKVTVAQDVSRLPAYTGTNILGTGFPSYTVVIPGANSGVTLPSFNDDFSHDFNIQ